MISASIYSSEKFKECSMNGVSSRCIEVMVFGQNEPYSDDYNKEWQGKPVEPVRLVKGFIGCSVIAIPIDPETGEDVSSSGPAGSRMFGGAYVSSSDSRFGEMVADIMPEMRYGGAIALHDRLEPWR